MTTMGVYGTDLGLIKWTDLMLDRQTDSWNRLHGDRNPLLCISSVHPCFQMKNEKDKHKLVKYVLRR